MSFIPRDLQGYPRGWLSSTGNSATICTVSYHVWHGRTPPALQRFPRLPQIWAIPWSLVPCVLVAASTFFLKNEWLIPLPWPITSHTIPSIVLRSCLPTSQRCTPRRIQRTSCRVDY